MWRAIPLHLQFNYALIYRWWTGKDDPRVTDPRVIAALKEAHPYIVKATKTRSARRA